MKKVFVLLTWLLSASALHAQGGGDRAYWVGQLVKMIDPIYTNLSRHTLRQNMPVETPDGLNTGNTRKDVTHLEALGRSFAGLAPWLNLAPDDSDEGRLRAKYTDMVVRSLANAVDPASPDYMPFAGPESIHASQTLVDAAYVAQGLLRSKEQIWPRLDTTTQARLIRELKASRRFKPADKNWLMFSATIEAALLEFTGECNMKPIDYAIMRHKEWYKGDGWYGDGRRLHMDYYNSFVIQPMLVDVLEVLARHGRGDAEFRQAQMTRFVRFAEQLERLIGPDGSYPPLGRSITYRLAAFQALSQVALMKQLPRSLQPAQVRCALTQAMRRQLVEGTYDREGWLQISFCGHQRRLAEKYVSTGSLYMCSLVFLPLGLEAEDEFWSGEAVPWTSLRMWSSDPTVKPDHALRD